MAPMAEAGFYFISRRNPGEYEIVIDGTSKTIVLSAVDFLIRLRNDAFPEEQIKRIFLTLDRERFIRVPLPR
jgi:hypothetical protein